MRSFEAHMTVLILGAKRPHSTKTPLPSLYPGALLSTHADAVGIARRDPQLSRSMVFPVAVALNIADSVVQRLREEAAQRGTTMPLLAEVGLRRILAEPATSDSPTTGLAPLPKWNSGKELVDISNRDLLFKVMEEE